MSLNPIVTEFCDSNRGKNYAGCIRCKISNACFSGANAHTRDSIEAWEKRLYDAVVDFQVKELPLFSGES